jgi:hypothetical protein
MPKHPAVCSFQDTATGKIQLTVTTHHPIVLYVIVRVAVVSRMVLILCKVISAAPDCTPNRAVMIATIYNTSAEHVIETALLHCAD